MYMFETYKLNFENTGDCAAAITIRIDIALFFFSHVYNMIHNKEI